MPAASSKTPSPPSTASSTSTSSSDTPLPTTTSSSPANRLHPPKPLFFIDKNRSAAADMVVEERHPDSPSSSAFPSASPSLTFLPRTPPADRDSNPFGTPDVSVPGTPRTQAGDPFCSPVGVGMGVLDGPPSPPPSMGTSTTTGIPHALHSRVQSRVSVNSSLRSTIDLPGTTTTASSLISNNNNIGVLNNGLGLGLGGTGTIANSRPTTRQPSTITFRDSFMAPPPLSSLPPPPTTGTTTTGRRPASSGLSTPSSSHVNFSAGVAGAGAHTTSSRLSLPLPPTTTGRHSLGVGMGMGVGGGMGKKIMRSTMIPTFHSDSFDKEKDHDNTTNTTSNTISNGTSNDNTTSNANGKVKTTQTPKRPITPSTPHTKLAYLLTYAIALLGVGGSVVRCWTAWRGVQRVGGLCEVMSEEFELGGLDEGVWTREVDMSGFGNGEFEMTTASSNNSFVEDGKLYIVPTLTSDVIGYANVLDGYTYNITGCTNSNLTACGAVSNATSGTVIPPVMSARLTTKNSHHITYGKVEIRAKLPEGDWLWPALWMLPVDDSYGPWPMSGEIDIMESRGNGVGYKAQGRDVVRGSLNWGPFTWLNGVSKTYGWWSTRRSTFSAAFHTYTLEWSPAFIRIYVDTRLHKMLDVSFLKQTFFERGQFPPYVANGSQTIQTPDPWVEASEGVSPGKGWGVGKGKGEGGGEGGGNGKKAAPFDKPFYLIMNVAVGGTNGWFPDGVGGKPWLDGSHVAMSTFARAQDQWYKTWPQNPKDRALVVDSVKMWQAC